MRKKKHNNIKESQVEEALVSNLIYLKKILNLTPDIKLIARQLILKSIDKRLDLLIMSGKELCLIELKVSKFVFEYIKQVNDYRKELKILQKKEELVSGKIRAFLLVTDYNKKKEKLICDSNKIEIVKYEPLGVLNKYFDRIYLATPFFKIKPNDYGVFNIGLINRVLVKVNEGIFYEKNLSKEIKLSKGTVHNHLRVAKEFGLVRKKKLKYFLTDFGDKFIEKKNTGILINIISEKQAELIKKFIVKDPFYSSTVYGIFSIVESVFILSKNSYPIEFNDLIKIFKIVSGKVSEWKSDRAQQTATYTFLNYAIQLGLLGKIGHQIVITPNGFDFILMLQLYKSIEMIESLSLK